MTNAILKTKDQNGLTRIGDSFHAKSGFRYASGYRNFGHLQIVEDVAGGTGVTFLCGVKIFDQEGTLIIDKKVAKGFHYEREAVRKLLFTELLNMLLDNYANDENFDLEKAKLTIDEQLKQAYYASSNQAITRWALELGILNKK